MSAGWFVFDDVMRSPIAGPFDHKGQARTECDRIRQERKTMGDKDPKKTADDDVADETNGEDAATKGDEAGDARTGEGEDGDKK